jgi:N-acetylglucosaminyldiphosphoundecaprenol N-acetyl-beta-D-mannosaminyltransferase
MHTHEREIRNVTVLDVPLAATDYAGAVAKALSWARRGEGAKAISAANSHVLTLSKHDPEFRAAFANFDLVLPDGMPLVWVMNWRLDEPLHDRVYGPTFMLHCLEAAHGPEWSHFFLGGSEEMLVALEEKLTARVPSLRCASHSPPFGQWPEEEDERIIARIRDSGAQFVWIGLGCPKQELWLGRNKHRLPPAVYSAVGAAFAFHAGRVRQAPRWMQRAGLEWFFRVLTEPRRLWRRFMVHNSLFIYGVFREEVARRTRK